MKHLERVNPRLVLSLETVGLLKIYQERIKQMSKYDTSHDDQHKDGSLIKAARAFLAPSRSEALQIWPLSWGIEHFKWEEYGEVRRVEVAGALVVAELDRLYRAQERSNKREASS